VERFSPIAFAPASDVGASPQVVEEVATADLDKDGDLDSPVLHTVNTDTTGRQNSLRYNKPHGREEHTLVED